MNTALNGCMTFHLIALEFIIYYDNVIKAPSNRINSEIQSEIEIKTSKVLEIIKDRKRITKRINESIKKIK